jgi:hypothetical protein
MDFLGRKCDEIDGAHPRKDRSMSRLFLSVAFVVMAASLHAQEKLVLPTQAETLAKWPWSISLQSAPFRQQSIQIRLAPKEGMEFKYRLEEKGAMLYSWTATANVHWELHSQPDNSPRGYAEFFDTQDGNGSHGAYNAPFPGIHGWWWENKSDQDVTITLTTAGFYAETHEFRKGVPVKVTKLE